MGRSSDEGGDEVERELFPGLPESRKPNALISTIEESATWSVDKARLVEEYIRLYQLITYGGIFIDGFAAPQRQDESTDLWTVKRILEIEPKWIQRFFLCDFDDHGIQMLRRLKQDHEGDGRKISVFHGDFNQQVDTILATGRVRPKTPCFAFLDQRTTECHWKTVQKLANWRQQRRIELLYFFPSGWLGRTIGGTKTADGFRKLDQWWGCPDWRTAFDGLSELQRMNLMRDRFKNELGYTYVTAWPVYRSKSENRTLYHLIHASNHPAVNDLMRRAFIKVYGHKAGSPAVSEEQIEMFANNNPS